MVIWSHYPDRDYFGCAIFLSNPVFGGGLTLEGEFIRADHHIFNLR